MTALGGSFGNTIQQILIVYKSIGILGIMLVLAPSTLSVLMPPFVAGIPVLH